MSMLPRKLLREMTAILRMSPTHVNSSRLDWCGIEHTLQEETERIPVTVPHDTPLQNLCSHCSSTEERCASKASRNSYAIHMILPTVSEPVSAMTRSVRSRTVYIQNLFPKCCCDIEKESHRQQSYIVYRRVFSSTVAKNTVRNKPVHIHRQSHALLDRITGNFSMQSRVHVLNYASCQP